MYVQVWVAYNILPMCIWSGISKAHLINAHSLYAGFHLEKLARGEVGVVTLIKMMGVVIIRNHFLCDIIDIHKILVGEAWGGKHDIFGAARNSPVY